jgi:8-oxo-dGTP diphosphatase
MPSHRKPTLSMSTDIVIFTIREERLEVLLIQRKNPPFQGSWALPGGFLEVDEDLDVCARRELEEETGVTGLELEQLHTFGAPHRDPRGRVVTVAYFTLVQAGRMKPPRAASDAANVRWFEVDNLPSLAFDHAEILSLARRRLQQRLEFSAAAFHYLPKTFTLSELQSLFEIIRGERLDTRKFRRWALAADLVEKTSATQTGSRRSAMRFRPKRKES